MPPFCARNCAAASAWRLPTSVRAGLPRPEYRRCVDNSVCPWRSNRNRVGAPRAPVQPGDDDGVCDWLGASAGASISAAASIASLASRSAWLFFDRGKPRVGDAVKARRQRRGLLIQDRDVGVLDLPAARHLFHHKLGVHRARRRRWRRVWRPPRVPQSARGIRRRCWWRARWPACSPRAPRRDRPTTPPSRIPQVPGCRATRRRLRQLPSRAGPLDPQQDCPTLRAAQYLVVGGRGDARQLALVDLDTAGTAATPLQQPGARPAPCPLTFVQRDRSASNSETSSSRRETDWCRS